MTDHHNGARPEHVDRAEKLLKMRGTGDHYRKVAVERKIRELSPDVHAAATARLSGPVRQPKAPAHVHQSGSTSTPSHRTPPARATRQRPPAVTTSGSHPPAGTQMEMTTDFAESAPDLLFREYQMGRLPQKMGGTRLGWPLNEDAKSLLRKFDKLGRVAADIGKKRDLLQWEEYEHLPRLLAGLEQERTEIGKRAAKDPALAEAINKYAESVPELRARMDEVTAARKRLLAFATGLKIVKELKDQSAAEKQATDAEAKVKEVQEKAEALRARVGTVIGYAENLIKDPTSYHEILKDAAQYLQGKALDFLLGDVYGPELKEAQDALAAAKKNIDNIKSSIEIDRISKATDDLDAAQSTFSASLEKLKAAVRRLKGSEHTVIKGLEAIGGGAAEAARAVESRAEVVTIAEEGKKLVVAYLEICAAIAHDAQGLARKYHDYWTTLQKERHRLQEDDLPVTDDAKVRLQVQRIAENNESVVAKIEAHAEEERKLAVSVDDYLKGETYLSLYEKIEDTLQGAVNDR